jgi:MFS family permease
MSEPNGWALFKNRNFTVFMAARFCAALSTMMIGVAVGWQVYEITHSAFALGMVGLAQFVPAFVFALPGGLVADRVDRRKIILTVFAVELAAALLLLGIAMENFHSAYPIFGVLILVGAGRSFLSPASHSFLPFLVTEKEFPQAVAWNSTAFQCAIIAGPALGGFIYAAGPEWVYGTSVFLLLLSVMFVSLMKGHWKVHSSTSGLKDIFSGVIFVFSRKPILGAISLDLFAVLFGGATALLPVFAKEILSTGPWGLGLLRSAPAVGAAITAVWLAHHPLARNAGKKMFLCVGVFGLATIAFALSNQFWLSAFFLVILGAADMISVVIRQTIVQISTPDEMRGRVSAVSSIFIGASNELGEFESGATAALFGTVPATALGGIGTLAVVGLWAWLFPSLRRTDKLVKNAE